MTMCPKCNEFVGCKCLRCGHEWIPKIDGETKKLIEPNVCPRCKSSYWNRPKRREVTKLPIPVLSLHEMERGQEEALKNKPKRGGLR